MAGNSHLYENEEGEEGDGNGTKCYCQSGRPGNVGTVIETDKEERNRRSEGESSEEIDLSKLFHPVGICGFSDVENKVDGYRGDDCHRELHEKCPGLG